MTPRQKTEANRDQEIWVWMSRHVKTISTFSQFWSIKIPLDGKNQWISMKDLEGSNQSEKTEKHEFQYRNESILKTFLTIAQYQISLQELNEEIFNPSLFEKKNFFDRYIVARNRTCSYGEIWIRFQRFFKIINILVFFDHQRSEARNKIKKFQIELSTTNNKN